MTAQDVIGVMTSRGFLALGVPLTAVVVELIVRMNAKTDKEPVFAWTDLDYGISLLTTAFVSVPALLAARATAIESASEGTEQLDAATLAIAAIGMASIGILAMLMGIYERRIGRRYRTEDHGLLTPILGVFVQLLVGVITLSFVYVLTPRVA
jgi:hypothetical protein